MREIIHYRNLGGGNVIWLYRDFEMVARKPGDPEVRMDGLMCWEGEITSKRPLKIHEGPVNISRYFKGYSGKAYIRGMSNRYSFTGTGPLKLPL